MITFPMHPKELRYFRLTVRNQCGQVGSVGAAEAAVRRSDMLARLAWALINSMNILGCKGFSGRVLWTEPEFTFDLFV